MLTMHGPHGLAAIVRALLEMRNADSTFESEFLLMAAELTAVLQCAINVFSETPDDETVFDNVLAALEAMPCVQTAAVTELLEGVVDSDSEQAAAGQKRKGGRGQAGRSPGKRVRSSAD